MDRDFLFGVIAVQLGQATPQQVMAAASAYVVDRSKSIPDRMLADGVFTDERFRMLSAMVDDALKAHGGDVKKTIHTLGGERAVFASFGGSLVVDAKGGLSIAPRTGSVGHSTEDTVAVQPEAPGRYQFTGSEVGRGGIGRVLIAYDEFLGREIAVKELLGNAGASQPSTPHSGAVSRTSAAVARFLREARVTGQLEHPNIVPVYEVGQRPDGTFYYTMKLVRGRTMADALKECRSLSDRLKLLHHYVNLCNAVAYAHSRGVIHRDLKPDNVMLQERGRQRDVVRVLDFGIAKLRDENRATQMQMTQAGDMLGTPQYMAPEQARGEQATPASDVYALGVVAFECLAGRRPFEADSPVATALAHLQQPVPDLPDDVP
ncbi:MAG: serine/threonine-protein kinase, partial [Myxococcota bacterium]